LRNNRGLAKTEKRKKKNQTMTIKPTHLGFLIKKAEGTRYEFQKKRTMINTSDYKAN